MTVQGHRKMIEGKQLEYGTCNAVLTFLQDYLGVRWFWPGDSGEDVPKRSAIAFQPFEYRYHPKIRARARLFTFSALGENCRSGEWSRQQRLQLDSLDIPGGHAFSSWFDRFHTTRPELFALQPDGTRSGYPSPRCAKLCQSNPEVWKQWLADVEEQLQKDPNETVFNVSPNDSILCGACICSNCVALDHPDGAPVKVFWQETGQEYVAFSDRFVAFANRLARMLKERYPDREFDVLLHAYSEPSRPPPVAATLDKNVIISFVGSFPWGEEKDCKTEQNEWLGWVKQGAGKMIYRPNTGSRAGWQLGLPEVMMNDTIATFTFLNENNCMGVFVDGVWEHWAAHAPQYYLMAQLTWNPAADGHAILDDYYGRGFGPAAPEIKAYWKLFEDARKAFVNSDTAARGLLNFDKLYSPELLAKAGKLLDAAAAKATNQPPYADRVAFIKAGYEYTRLVMDNVAMMNQYLDGDKKDAVLADKMRMNLDEIPKIFAAHPLGINDIYVGPKNRLTALHPDLATYVKPQKKGEARAPVKLQPAEETGWTLAFRDIFDRKELGGDWKAIEGQWKIVDGVLRGSGTLVLDRDFAKGEELIGQRLEFEATTDVAPVLMIKGKPKPRVIVSDMSSFVQAQSPEQKSNPFMTGYFFQFGGFTGTRNRLLKGGKELVKVEDPDITMVPNKPHKIVAENDQGRLRLFVDGELALEYQDEKPSALSGQSRVGLYFYSAAKVPEIKVYVKMKK
jgi:hypothetical protein